MWSMHRWEKAVNSFGELGPKREVVRNGVKGPKSDFGGDRLLGLIWLQFGQNLTEQN